MTGSSVNLEDMTQLSSSEKLQLEAIFSKSRRLELTNNRNVDDIDCKVKDSLHLLEFYFRIFFFFKSFKECSPETSKRFLICCGKFFLEIEF